MKNKKRRNVVVVHLTQEQRRALWASLKLLACLDYHIDPGIDEKTMDILWALFSSLDEDARTLGIEFTAREHRAIRIMVKYSQMYVTHNRDCFDGSTSVILDQQLMAHTQDILTLFDIFQCT